MTREEAIVYFEKILAGAKQGLEEHPEEGKRVYGMRKELAEIALTALRPVSRERVEKVWKSEWIDNGERDPNGVPKTFAISCKRCGSSSGISWMRFCPNCGAPMTDEAVQMVMERLEAMKDAKC